MAGNKPALTEKELSNWKLLERFTVALNGAMSQAKQHPTFEDPDRKLGCASYLSLYLFGLFNPVVESMRGLCAASGLAKVRAAVGTSKVSLGSFSEAQHVLDLDLLKRVFAGLVEQIPLGPVRDPQLAHLQLIAQDGSLWRALPRMGWAEYGVGCHGQAKGVRMHLRFNLLKDCPSDVRIGVGKSHETKALREMLEPGQTSVGDRLYGQDYRLFADIQQAGAFFVFRICDAAVIEVEETLPVSAADQAAGVVRHAWVHLGATEKLRSIRLRLVEVKKEGHHLLLVTNHPVETVPAEWVSLIYRRRWSIELFFRWIKCVLGCRHFLAESPKGVAIHLYLALIAALLLQHFLGRRPTKRMMELLRFYILGWASAEEVVAQILAATEPAASR